MRHFCEKIDYFSSKTDTIVFHSQFHKQNTKIKWKKIENFEEMCERERKMHFSEKEVFANIESLISNDNDGITSKVNPTEFVYSM